MKTFTITRQIAKLGNSTLKEVTDNGNDVTRYMAEKGIGVAVSKSMTLFGIHLGQGLHKDTENLTEGTTARLHNLDVVESKQGDDIVPSRVVQEANFRDHRALICIDLDAGEGGEVEVLANWRKEARDQKTGRIIRVPVPIEEALGVTVLATGACDTGQRFLLSVDPGASFKVMLGGRLGRGEPREFVCEWHGHWDRWASDDRQPIEELVKRRADMANWGLKIRARG